MAGIDIYLRDFERKHRIRFPMLPEKIQVKAGAVFQSYNLMSLGEIKIPAGQQLTAFSWEGTLPGAARKNEPYIKAWMDPREIQGLWSDFRAGKTKLHLLITGTPISHRVYLDKYTVDYAGGYGDYKYTISFLHAKDIVVCEVGENATNGAGSNAAAPGQNQARPSHATSATYTVKPGDSLWSIAQELLGAGARYDELYEANKADIDARNKPQDAPVHTIYAGQVLNIP